MSIRNLHNEASCGVSPRPEMSAADFAFAVAKRRQGASWDSIGAMLRRPADAVRRACDPGYVSPYPSARPVAAIAPEQGLFRRLTADGMTRVNAAMLSALHKSDAPVPIDQLAADAGAVPPSAGQKSLQSAMAQLRRAASAAGYPITITTRGYALTPKAREALNDRLANPVR